MKYIAVDPSYTKTGIAILNEVSNTLSLKVVTPPGKNETFRDAVERSAIIATGVIEELKVYEKAILLIEEPMVTSMMASRLGMLSGIVITTSLLLPNISNIYTVNPVSITSLNSALPYKKEMSKKRLSQRVAGELIEFFTDIGYAIDIRPLRYNKDGSPRARVVSHDEAEALILLTLLLLEIDFFSKEDKLKIYKINKGFLTKKIQVNKLK